MKIIEKIQIRHFRSFDDDNVIIEDLNDLNIFSGGNDCGKSNILRALNLFFNNEVSPGVPFDINRDFAIGKSEKIKDQSKPKIFVDITVHFKARSTKLRDERFSIKKRWNIDSEHSTTVFRDKNWSAEIFNIYREPNIVKKFEKEEKYSGQRSKSINTFLNKIFFFYVPAVKDDAFYSHLYAKLLTKIKENEDSQDPEKEKIFSTIEKLERLINDHSSSLLDGIEDLKTTFSVPEKLEDFFYGFDLNTKGTGSGVALKGVSIKQRGDGIRAKSIPLLLELIEKNEKAVSSPLFLWGFEEPENSYEYKNAQALATRFLEKYSNDKQIFITSHSFNFLTLKGSNVSRYRVWKENDYSSRIILLPDNKEELQKQLFKLKKDEDQLYEELGIPLLSEDLQALWEEKNSELENIKSIREKAKEDGKICILTEGRSDVEFLTIILDKYLEKWNDKYKFIDQDHGHSTNAESLRNTLITLSATDPNSKYIGIFDNDKAGLDAFNKLIKGLNKNVKAIVLPELDWAKNWKIISKFLDSAEVKIDLNGKALPIEMYFWSIFKDEFTDDEKKFEFDQVPKLPKAIKEKLSLKIKNIDSSVEIPDGEKIAKSVEAIEFK